MPLQGPLRLLVVLVCCALLLGVSGAVVSLAGGVLRVAEEIESSERAQAEVQAPTLLSARPRRSDRRASTALGSARGLLTWTWPAPERAIGRLRPGQGDAAPLPLRL